LDHLTAAAEQFNPQGEILEIREYGSGNVNDTFLVSLRSCAEDSIILQRVNTRVFLRPKLIMLNLRTFTEHVRRRLRRERAAPDRRWEVPSVFSARDGSDYFIDGQGAFWRAISFIDASRSYDTVRDIEHAREAGYALGRFHSLISDLEPARLHDTLEGFHITPRYLQHYDQVLAENGSTGGSPEVDCCLRFVERHRKWASILEDAKGRGELSLRSIHGDPKVNNIMIDQATGRAVSIVDLDTVKPGLIHYDIGDCLRSCCNPLGEETDDLEGVYFDTALCRAILRGYISVASGFLDESDYVYIYDSICLIAFELGMRFFTDYLEGNVYFKAEHERHNLMRALVQFKLTESIESQETEIRAIVGALKS